MENAKDKKADVPAEEPTKEMMLPLTHLSIKQLTEDVIEASNVWRQSQAEVDEALVPVPPSDPPERRRPRKKAVRPSHQDLKKGWGNLLAEVSASSRRVRVAYGGHIGSQSGNTDALSTHRAPPTHGVEPLAKSGTSGLFRMETSGGSSSSTAAATQLNEAGSVHTREEDKDAVWLSYRIDQSRVPDSVLRALWNLAVDPKHRQEEVQPLERVPRLTVTKRKVQQLPPVQSILYWCQFNRKRKERRKEEKENERHPSLDEMLRLIFGEHPVGGLGSQDDDNSPRGVVYGGMPKQKTVN